MLLELPTAGDAQAALDLSTLSALQQELDCDNETFTDLLECYLAEARCAMEDMRKALGDANLPAIRGMSHRIKSSSASVGALTLSACCAEIERLAERAIASAADESTGDGAHASQRAMATITPLITQASDEMTRVIDALTTRSMSYNNKSGQKPYPRGF